MQPCEQTSSSTAIYNKPCHLSIAQNHRMWLIIRRQFLMVPSYALRK